MKPMSRLLVCALAGLLCLSLAAQDAAKDQKPAAKKPSAAKKTDKPASAGMPMPKPSPEMAKFIKLTAGNWKTAEEYEAVPEMKMPGGKGEGTAKMWPGPGGLSLMESYKSKGPMGSVIGFGTFWWDAKVGGYRGMWCDNGTPAGCDAGMVSKWDGDKLVGTADMDMGGQKLTFRLTYSDFKPDSFVMTMEMGPDANSLKKTTTLTFTKEMAMAAKPDEKPKQ